MRNTIWEKRIPTLLGIFLIVVGIGITTFIVRQGSIFVIRATPTQQPKDVRITNITDASFTVSYTTDDQVVGSINYGTTNNLGQTSLDERDQQTVLPHKIHSITVRNLSPQTRYFFTIISGQDTYMNNNVPFDVSTAPTIQSQPPQQNPMSGKVILPDGTSPKEAIVYLTSDNSQVISTLVKSDGSYILPLNSLRTNDLSSYFQLTETVQLKMLSFGDGLTSNILLSSSQISPVPTITLSKDYDFRQTQAPVASVSANLQSFPSFSSNSQTSQGKSPEILTPQKDQGFTDQQPQFKGTALPDQSVQIIIHSDQQLQTAVTTDSNGNWSYRPTTPLSPGTHTITIIAKDASGVLRTITQSFVVFASGTQVSQSATPSATLTPTPTLTPTIIASAPTPTPTTVVLSPTPTTVINQISTPTPTRKPLPPTGNPSIMTAGIVGIIISLMGGLLFLLSRGGISTL